jgi:hypothetical protein
MTATSQSCDPNLVAGLATVRVAAESENSSMRAMRGTLHDGRIQSSAI